MRALFTWQRPWLPRLLRGLFFCPGAATLSGPQKDDVNPFWGIGFIFFLGSVRESSPLDFAEKRESVWHDPDRSRGTRGSLHIFTELHPDAPTTCVTESDIWGDHGRMCSEQKPVCSYLIKPQYILTFLLKNQPDGRFWSWCYSITLFLSVFPPSQDRRGYSMSGFLVLLISIHLYIKIYLNISTVHISIEIYKIYISVSLCISRKWSC